MDGKLRRQIGRKVTDCGGNALLGYQTHFDLEDNYIIARGIGTAVTLQESAVVQKAVVLKQEKESGNDNAEQDGEGGAVVAAAGDDGEVHVTRSPVCDRSQWMLMVVVRCDADGRCALMNDVV